MKILSIYLLFMIMIIHRKDGCIYSFQFYSKNASASLEESNKHLMNYSFGLLHWTKSFAQGLNDVSCWNTHTHMHTYWYLYLHNGPGLCISQWIENRWIAWEEGLGWKFRGVFFVKTPESKTATWTQNLILLKF